MRRMRRAARLGAQRVPLRGLRLQRRVRPRLRQRVQDVLLAAALARVSSRNT